MTERRPTSRRRPAIAKTRGILKITRSDGTEELVGKATATMEARATVRKAHKRSGILQKYTDPTGGRQSYE